MKTRFTALFILSGILLSILCGCGNNADNSENATNDTAQAVTTGTLDVKAGAENYLRKGGLTDDQIQKIEAYIR